jgi:hypothetical protein
MMLSRVLAWLREEPNRGDFTKGKIKYGKDAITLGSNKRSATPADKLRTRKTTAAAQKTEPSAPCKAPQPKSAVRLKVEECLIIMARL